MIAAAARVEVSVAGTVLPYVSAVHVVQRLGQPATCELRVTPGGGPASIGGTNTSRGSPASIAIGACAAASTTGAGSVR